MEAWVLVLAFRAGWGHSIRQLDMQNEDSCVIAAKELTIKSATVSLCINTFDGRVLYFHAGKQVERFQ